jgi:vacuolar protein sorting-associated protein 53
MEEENNNIHSVPSVFQYSSELQEAISEIAISSASDPLDDPKFNSVDYINKLFPNELSLVEMDNVIHKLKVKMRTVDRDLVRQVRQLSSAGDKAAGDLTQAQDVIAELFSKINGIKAKAEQSEQMVQEICKDIKDLDYAKKHITTTITGLKRIHMLETGVSQLTSWTEKRQYREVGNLLEAVTQLSLYFSSYTKIEKIVALTKEVERIKAELKKKVLEEFRM